MARPPEYPVGTTINGRYVLGAKLGSDGSVYAADDLHLSASVALKVLHPHGNQAQSWDEAKRLEQLQSRFVVRVINADVVTSTSIRFIVTPLLEAGDLEAAARGVGLSLQDAVRLAQQIAIGIGRIHAAGMVHRDIKPANVLLDGDQALVSDLERCAVLDISGRAGRDGTWCTAAPECATDGGYSSVASDVYSLAATAFYLLSGEYPVDHRLGAGVQRDEIVAGRLRELRALAPHVPVAVANVIRKGLHLEPASRHSTAEEFGNALAGAMRGRRNWRRVDHDQHLHCLIGDRHRGRAPVSICSVAADPRVKVQSRNLGSKAGSKVRQVRGVPDVEVGPAELAKHLQRLVASLC